MKLVKYDALRRALAEAVSVDEVLRIKELADKMAAYSRIAEDKDAEADFLALRWRALRALGQLIEEQRKLVGLAKGSQPHQKRRKSTGYRIASEARSARKLIDRLDQAVLAKAFRGELVPQDPSDEPASMLLERIREERARAASGKMKCKANAKTHGLPAALS